jgi:MGT family glycosyltransferase
MFAERRNWHFGVLSFTGTGHLIPLISLSQELKHRGHRVTFFEKPKIGDRVRDAGLEFFPILPNGASKQRKPPVKGRGTIWFDISTLRFNIRRIVNDVETFLYQTPPALKQAGVEALIVNEIALTGPTLAQQLQMPYFIVSTSVPHNFGWDAFPWYSGHRNSISPMSWLGKNLLEVSALRIRGPIRYTIDHYRRTVGLGPVRDIQKVFPALAHITQLAQCLDLPGTKRPDNFYYTAPFVNRSPRPLVEFPWDRLDGRPVIYASLGTTRNVQASVFRLLADACQDLDHQLVISLGGRFDAGLFTDLPGNPLVVTFAPQLDLLRLAKLVITHAGPNTVFEALMEGKPMVAIPIALDQPAIAARLARLKIAEVLPIKRLTAQRIRAAVIRVLRDPSYRIAAVNTQSIIRSIHGSERAADVIEEALRSRPLPSKHEMQTVCSPPKRGSPRNDPFAASSVSR